MNSDWLPATHDGSARQRYIFPNPTRYRPLARNAGHYHDISNEAGAAQVSDPLRPAEPVMETAGAGRLRLKWRFFLARAVPGAVCP